MKKVFSLSPNLRPNVLIALVEWSVSVTVVQICEVRVSYKNRLICLILDLYKYGEYPKGIFDEFPVFVHEYHLEWNRRGPGAAGIVPRLHFIVARDELSGSGACSRDLRHGLGLLQPVSANQRGYGDRTREQTPDQAYGGHAEEDVNQVVPPAAPGLHSRCQVQRHRDGKGADAEEPGRDFASPVDHR